MNHKHPLRALVKLGMGILLFNLLSACDSRPDKPVDQIEPVTPDLGATATTITRDNYVDIGATVVFVRSLVAQMTALLSELAFKDGLDCGTGESSGQFTANNQIRATKDFSACRLDIASRQVLKQPFFNSAQSLEIDGTQTSFLNQLFRSDGLTRTFAHFDTDQMILTLHSDQQSARTITITGVTTIEILNSESTNRRVKNISLAGPLTIKSKSDNKTNIYRIDRMEVIADFSDPNADVALSSNGSFRLDREDARITLTLETETPLLFLEPAPAGAHEGLRSIRDIDGNTVILDTVDENEIEISLDLGRDGQIDDSVRLTNEAFLELIGDEVR